MHHVLMLMPLLALVLFLVLPWPYALVAYILIVGISLLGYWKVLQALRRPPVTGRKAMIGGRAEVIRSKPGESEVRYRGETWQATSNQALRPGQEVIIKDIEGLMLHVAPAPQPAEEQHSRQAD
jgi:membrane protein implicated in regulation of membrane protease activity